VHVEPEAGEVFHTSWSLLLEVAPEEPVDVGVVCVDVVGDIELCALGAVLLVAGVDDEVAVCR
jgi:hypothetical protein